MRVQCDVSAFLTGNVEIEESSDGELVCRRGRAPGLSVNPVVNFMSTEDTEELTEQQKSIIVLSSTAFLLECITAEVHKQLKEVGAGVVARASEKKGDVLQ